MGSAERAREGSADLVLLRAEAARARRRLDCGRVRSDPRLVRVRVRVRVRIHAYADKNQLAQPSASLSALRRLLSAPEHASGCPELLRSASANQPLGPHQCWPATPALLSTQAAVPRRPWGEGAKSSERSRSSAALCCSLQCTGSAHAVHGQCTALCMHSMGIVHAQPQCTPASQLGGRH